MTAALSVAVFDNFWATFSRLEKMKKNLMLL